MRKIGIFISIVTFFMCSKEVFGQVKKGKENETAPKKLLLHKMDPNNLNFGLSLDINFNLLGAGYGNYAGRVMPRMGVFFTKPVNKYYVNSFISLWDFFVEPVALNIISSREKNLDNQYGGYYYDPTFALHLIPERGSSDLRIIFGVKPSVLLYSYTEVLQNGEYSLSPSQVEANRNRAGDIDFSGLLGISFKFSSIGYFDMKYIHSFTNNTTSQYVKGRPNLMEFGIRLSAVEIGKTLFDIDAEIQKELIKLSKGTLLVMLPTPNPNEIKALTDLKKYEEIKHLQFQQDATNKMVVEKFSKDYAFSNVLFFYDTSATKIVNKNFNNVFVDEGGLLVPAPNTFDSSNFFIASFCDDVSTFTNKFTYGLHVYDSKMQALPKPFSSSQNDMGLFPDGDIIAYMRKKRALFNINEYEKIIKRFNNRLTEIKIKEIEN